MKSIENTTNNTITFRISNQEKEKLRAFAKERGLQMSGLVKLAVFEYIKQNS